ncbi:glutaredoxin 3 [Gammaproteobacteria bacterium AB-CW1]|uniref:Glutaredoxin n=1 Tax=Natronospira elongata TaxID=3110268 RepID=A0AAP6JF35_9GAMM|nr:glutaredoxin 3 [Gammaproteobacteria bacterium AB-CW1]
MDHPPVLMYSKRSCPFCVRAKALLQSKGVEFEEIDLIIEPERRDEMIRRAGARTVPQIFIGDQPIGGYDELSALERDGRLDQLLAA